MPAAEILKHALPLGGLLTCWHVFVCIVHNRPMTCHADLLQEPDQNVQLPAAAQHYDDSSVISYMCQQAPDVRYLESKKFTAV